MQTSAKIDQYLSLGSFHPSIYEGFNRYILEGGLSNPKEWQYILPKLLLRSFGGPDTPGWVDLIHTQSEDTMVSFYSTFHPTSQLFQSLLSQAHHPDIFFEIQLDKLPSPFQNTVLSGDILSLPSFFQSRLIFPKFNRNVISNEHSDLHLRLSLIEYFFFYFIYSWVFIQERFLKPKILDPNSQLSSSNVSNTTTFHHPSQVQKLSDPPITLYCNLLESYLHYLLPLQSASSRLESKFILNSFHSLTDTIFTTSSVKMTGSIDSKNILAASLSDTIISLIAELWLHDNHYLDVEKIKSNRILPYKSPLLGVCKAILVFIQHLAIIGLLEEEDLVMGGKNVKRQSSFLNNLRQKAYQTIRKPLYQFILQTFLFFNYERDGSVIGQVCIIVYHVF